MNPFMLSDASLQALLDDDHALGDATSWGLGIGEAPGRIEFRAREALLACCTEEAARMGVLRNLRVEQPPVSSGTWVEAGTCLLRLGGRAADLHCLWKPAQTLMEYAAGIATATAALVQAARRANPQVSVACTRKSFPGGKAISTKAILAGGAVPHRLSLSETLLVFAEHRAFLGAEAPSDTIGRLHRTWPERRLVVEVADEAEALRWMAAGADVVQLEKFSPEAVARIVRQAAAFGTRIAAAGGIHAGNAEAFARAGADILVSSWPYAAAARDVAVKLEGL